MRLIFAFTPRPIIAPTSQVGEVAVVRTPVSYKCGWGLNNVKYTPSLTLPAGEGMRVVVQFAPSPRTFEEREQLFLSRQAKVTDAGEGLKNYHSIQHPPTPFGYFPRKGGRCNSAQLAHIHHPLKFSSLRGNSHSTRSNPERITQLKTVGWVKPKNNNMDCRVASAPRNDTQPVSLLTKKPNIYPRNDAKLVVLSTNQNTFTPDVKLDVFTCLFGRESIKQNFYKT